MPGGAPSIACQALRPHHLHSPQSRPVPYVVDLSNLADGNGGFSYIPGESYLCMYIIMHSEPRASTVKRALYHPNWATGEGQNLDVEDQTRWDQNYMKLRDFCEAT